MWSASGTGFAQNLACGFGFMCHYQSGGIEMRIDKELALTINSPSTIKAIGTVSKNGVPHVVYKGSTHVDEDGKIVIYELLESSRNGQNLVYSIWFDKKVVISILDDERNSYEILGHPARCITCGKEFEQVYKSLRKDRGDVDLAAIWIIEPEEIKNESFCVRKQEEEREYPIIRHLDRVRA
jgi:hypothetical protein